jgi:hypothetical protein
MITATKLEFATSRKRPATRDTTMYAFGEDPCMEVTADILANAVAVEPRPIPAKPDAMIAAS